MIITVERRVTEMNTVKVENKGKVQMIAHRGVSGIERENTAASFVAAGNRSYFGIETDIHQTADGKYIIIHDDNTKWVSGCDYMVEQTDFDTLRSITLLSKDGGKNRGDLILPTLEEYISICKTYDKVAVLELKNAMSRETVLGIAKTIGEMGYLDSTIFISFELQNLIALREEYPTQTAQYLIGGEVDTNTVIPILTKYHLDLDAYFEIMTKEFADELHKNGIKINVWTVDKPEDAERMIACGVDYITSNILE